ncbi:MAG TPA: phosphonopyruvate decarboxylase [Steroidobacteraceae bacterium]|jgi:phosphonopyruvate decarboxylase
MIEARDFVEAARGFGFRWYAGVPCSFLTPFINYVLQDQSLRYVSMANEGDAVALIAGVALAGDGAGGFGRGIAMMQNSGLGNAVSPLTSLTATFKLPQLLIVTWRGQPGISDEPQHGLMGPITPKMLETMQIPFELFPTDRAQVEPALRRAVDYMDSHQRPFAFLMQKGSVAEFPLRSQARLPVPNPSAAHSQADSDADRPTRNEALRTVVQAIDTDVALLATTGFCGRELYAIADRPNQLYMVGSMGCVVPLALGLALARPEQRVLALDGDGAALMRLGAYATVGAYAPKNFSHLMLDNGAHDSTGGQATVSASVAFAHIAQACGYAHSEEFGQIGSLRSWLGCAASGPRFARLHIKTGTPKDLPRPAMTPEEVRIRFMRHFSHPRAHAVT